MIERAAKNAREAQYIIDLIGEIRPSCRDNHSSRSFRFMGHNFRDGIGEREHNRVFRHHGNHRGRDRFSLGDPHKDIRPNERVRRTTGDIARICPFEKSTLKRIQVGSAL